MKTGYKILIGVGVVAAVAALFAFKKKPKPPVKKGTIAGIGDSVSATDEGDMLRKGSVDGQHVSQLQLALIELHAAVKYITAKCGTWWPLYTGKMPADTGVFDDATENALQFYLNRKEIDLAYLNEIRLKLDKYRTGNKCKYPLSY